MNVSRLRIRIKKDQSGTFKKLNPGDIIDAGDFVINDCFVESPSDTSIGKTVEAKDCIIRLEFQEKTK